MEPDVTDHDQVKLLLNKEPKRGTVHNVAIISLDNSDFFTKILLSPLSIQYLNTPLISITKPEGNSNHLSSSYMRLSKEARGEYINTLVIIHKLTKMIIVLHITESLLS